MGVPATPEQEEILGRASIDIIKTKQAIWYTKLNLANPR
jgi:hypothetical protein